MVAPRAIVTSRLRRYQLGHDLNLDGHDTEHLSFDGKVVWRNPFVGRRFMDEEIAIASLLTASAAWATDAGPEPYPLADGCHDHLVGLAIDESVATSAPGDHRPGALGLSWSWAVSGDRGRCLRCMAACADAGASSSARSSADSTTLRTDRFSSRWATDEVPGISSTFGAWASNQARPTVAGATPSRVATVRTLGWSGTLGMFGKAEPSGKYGT